MCCALTAAFSQLGLFAKTGRRMVSIDAHWCIHAYQRHHDLARCRLASMRSNALRSRESKHLVDRQFQLAGFDCRPDVGAHALKMSRISCSERVRKVTPM